MDKRELTENLLYSSKKELISFIDKNYILETVKDFESVKKMEKNLMDLDNDVIEHCLYRIESMEDTFDPIKSLSSISGLLVLFFGFFMTDYMGLIISTFDNMDVKIILSVVVLMVVGFCVIALFKGINCYQKDKQKLIYFKKILEFVVEEKKEKLEVVA